MVFASVYNKYATIYLTAHDCARRPHLSVRMGREFLARNDLFLVPTILSETLPEYVNSFYMRAHLLKSFTFDDGASSTLINVC